MLKLIEGIHRFQTEIFGSQRELFERLAQGQAPEVLLITCSDSRIEENLRTHPVVAAGIAQGKLKLHGWVCKIETGEVFGYAADEGQFLLLSERRPPSPLPASTLMAKEI